MGKPYAVVSWDLDGTLVDSAPLLRQALHVFWREGAELPSLDRVRSWIGHGATALVNRALQWRPEHDPQGDPVIRYRQAYARLQQAGARSEPFDGAVDLMDRLDAAGIVQVLCTNKPERHSRLLLDQLGWNDRFARLLFGDSLAVKKPDPQHVLAAVEGLGGPAVHVGDTSADLDAAAAAGVAGVHVLWGYEPRASLHKGQVAVASFEALAELFHA